VPRFFRTQAAAYVLLPLAAVCWAGSHIIARAVGGHVPPASLAVARWILVAVLVLPFALPHLRRDWAYLGKSRGIMLLLAVTGGGAFGTLQFVALHFTTALNMGVVGSVAPAFIVAASWLLFRDRLNGLRLSGVLVSPGSMNVGAGLKSNAPEREISNSRGFSNQALTWRCVQRGSRSLPCSMAWPASAMASIVLRYADDW
jgi:uncharacterized membrane protein